MRWPTNKLAYRLHPVVPQPQQWGRAKQQPQQGTHATPASLLFAGGYALHKKRPVHDGHVFCLRIPQPFIT
jgi:hypothetical protein